MAPKTPHAEEAPRTLHLTLQAALDRGPPPPGRLSIPVFEHRSLEALVYQPEDPDRQTPHKRDEVYVVARGQAQFSDGQARRAVAPGDFIFVAAWQAHRFEDASPDFTCWVFFYGEEIPPGPP